MLSYFDESNYAFNYFTPTQIIQDNLLGHFSFANKIIINGSVDGDGQMKKIVDLANNNSKWKVLYYPWDKCYPMWDKDRVYRLWRNTDIYEWWKTEAELCCDTSFGASVYYPQKKYVKN